MKSSSSRKITRSVELVWSHCGALHRVTAWPDVAFARLDGSTWLDYEPDPSSDSFASAAVMIDAAKWSAYLEFLPAAERDFVNSFKHGRLSALVVLTRCPALFDTLVATPALAAFVANHVTLRGTGSPRWDEIHALYERGALFSLLEWLGLPASRQTLAILRKIANPDLSRRLLVPVRAALWEPETIWALEHAVTLNERELAGRCHALAA